MECCQSPCCRAVSWPAIWKPLACSPAQPSHCWLFDLQRHWGREDSCRSRCRTRPAHGRHCCQSEQGASVREVWYITASRRCLLVRYWPWWSTRARGPPPTGPHRARGHTGCGWLPARWRETRRAGLAWVPPPWSRWSRWCYTPPSGRHPSRDSHRWWWRWSTRVRSPNPRTETFNIDLSSSQTRPGQVTLQVLMVRKPQ